MPSHRLSPLPLGVAVLAALLTVLLGPSASLPGSAASAAAGERRTPPTYDPDPDDTSNRVIRAVNAGKTPPSGSVNKTPAAQLKAKHDQGYQFLYTSASKCSETDQATICRSTIRKDGTTRGTLYLTVNGTSTGGRVTAVRFAFNASS